MFCLFSGHVSYVLNSDEDFLSQFRRKYIGVICVIVTDSPVVDGLLSSLTGYMVPQIPKPPSPSSLLWNSLHCSILEFTNKQRQPSCFVLFLAERPSLCSASADAQRPEECRQQSLTDSPLNHKDAAKHVSLKEP